MRNVQQLCELQKVNESQVAMTSCFFIWRKLTVGGISFSSHWKIDLFVSFFTLDSGHSFTQQGEKENNGIWQQYFHFDQLMNELASVSL